MCIAGNYEPHSHAIENDGESIISKSMFYDAANDELWSNTNAIPFITFSSRITSSSLCYRSSNPSITIKDRL